MTLEVSTSSGREMSVVVDVDVASVVTLCGVVSAHSMGGVVDWSRFDVRNGGDVVWLLGRIFGNKFELFWSSSVWWLGVFPPLW